MSTFPPCQQRTMRYGVQSRCYEPSDYRLVRAGRYGQLASPFRCSEHAKRAAILNGHALAGIHGRMQSHRLDIVKYLVDR